MENYNNNNTYSVYIHTDPDNKKYVGMTKNAPEERWQKGGKGYATNNNQTFYNAILEIGWENFTHEIVAYNLSREEAEQLERELISKYNTTDRACGYNILPGVLRSERATKQYINTIRFAPELGKKLQIVADKEMRTVNNLITYVLTQYVNQYDINIEDT